MYSTTFLCATAGTAAGPRVSSGGLRGGRSFLEAGSLPSGVLRAIRREIRDPEGRVVLASETWLRRWLLQNGVPCWGSPEAPGARHRWGLMTRDGTRILVERFPGPDTRDRAAAACCAVTAAVESPGENLFRLRGWLTLADMDIPGGAAVLRPPGELPDFLGVTRSFAAAYILGTLRLLLAGDPEPPAKGLEGVLVYRPRRRFPAGSILPEG